MKTTILAFLAVLSPLVSRAADEIKIFDVKPGLWESTSKSEMTGMPAMASMPQIPEESLAKMPPEQRARVEAMMKGRSGGPQTNTSRSCVTRESLSRGFGQMDKTCTYKVVSSSPAKMDMHIECNRAGGKAEGEVIMERTDPEHVKGTVNMKAASGGSNFTMKVSNDSKWISADCGDVKPPEIK
jgi:uncharacterized protein DUF3617